MKPTMVGHRVKPDSRQNVMSATSGIEAQYSRGDLRARIADALQAAGRDLDSLSINDLGVIDEFHLLGRAATTDLAELAAIRAGDHVLDIGAGLGGPARLLAQHYACSVTTVDLSADYCETAEWLNRATGLSERITVLHADALDLPFADGSFDVVWSQHAQMNVADKRRLYSEARRVLKDGGRLATWDIIAGPVQPIHFPVPWADSPDISFLAQSDELREILKEARFEVTAWNDLTTQTIESLRARMAAPAGAVGLQTYVPNFSAKTANLLRNLEEQRIRMLQAVFTCE
jgi:sarcosine/dimethylglycine N-methyltransferase